jgi:hypothetical protein
MSRRTHVTAAGVIAAAAYFAAGAAAAEPGREKRWALDFQTRLEQSGRPVEIHLTGEWVEAISAARPGEYDAELRVEGLRFAGEGVDRVPAVEDARQRLERPFWGTYRDDGALVAVHFYRDMAPNDRNLLEMIATAAQFVRGPADRTVWTALERDGAGEYIAAYNRGATAVTKRKLKYTDTGGVSGEAARALRIDVDESELRFTLDTEGQAAALDGHERVRIGAALASDAPLMAVTEIHLGNPQRGHSTEGSGSLERAGTKVVKSAVVTQRTDPAQAEAQADERLLQNQTAAALLNAAVTGAEDTMLVDRLAALFRRKPETVPQAVRILREKGAIQRITDALGKAASPAAVEGLGELARDSKAPAELRIESLAAFVEMQNPSREAMAIPRALMGDGDARVSAEAELISGSMARAGREQHRAEADAIDAALVARFRAAHEETRIREVLAAMGNSGGPAVLPVIRQGLKDDRGAVRAAAVRSLRLLSGDDIDERLAAAITDDRDAPVRSDAVFAASFRHPLSAVIGEALVKAARGDSADYVRMAAIGLLRQNPEVSSQTVETLEWIAGNDAKPGVRRVARDALAVVKGQPEEK